LEKSQASGEGDLADYVEGNCVLLDTLEGRRSEGRERTVLHPVVDVTGLTGVGAADEFFVYASDEVMDCFGDFGLEGDDIGHGVYACDGLFEFGVESFVGCIGDGRDDFAVFHLLPYFV
jgi:hypothetical protein